MTGQAPALGARLVIATHNAGKLAEFRELLAPFGLDVVSAGELGLPEPEETGTTYAENARIKAETAAALSGLPALADDSGLAVQALWGAPGIFSARWAGPDKDFTGAMARVEEDLQDRGATAPEQRRAAFVAALCLATPDGDGLDVEGAVHGVIVWPPRGTLGFGYDPMFQPDGFDRTFGEMASDEKHGVVWDGAGRATGLSHRARAFGELMAALYPEGPPR
ncbi:RdgB/HAM1 family non-canonical purine NTP pyrophosphatase [Methylopila henanensis]|uniref:dITP/XTP pyrophosphatase n=1 Tax=Methylopila henanensis TaxID=873516 RepID=A0ABW4K8S3_9HYPH